MWSLGPTMHAETIQDFKYLGAWVKSTEQDVKTRKAMARKACNNLSKIWKSNLSKNIKIKLFQATVESVLLYGSETTGTVTKKIGKAVDGCYVQECLGQHLASAGNHISQIKNCMVISQKLLPKLPTEGFDLRDIVKKRERCIKPH